jgi:hypothetical protein
MTPAMGFFVLAGVLIAPHIPEHDAKLFSLFCVAVGIVFWILEIRK